MSARIPPECVAEGGWVEPGGDGLSYLREYVGTRNSMCLLYDPNVKPGPDSLLGEEFLRLHKNLDHRLLGGARNLEGSRRPTEWDWEETAMVMVSTHDGRVHAGICSEVTRTIYSRAERWTYLPGLLRASARGYLDPSDFEAPPDIVWNERP